MECTIEIKSPNDGLLRGFKYFWLKHVTGFNPAEHCAKCLLGSYVRIVSTHMSKNLAYSFGSKEGEIFYLCGVSSPYVWSKNFHLALRVVPNKSASGELYTGDKVMISGAESLGFDNKAALQRFPKMPADFLTCRNFQFGAQWSNG